MKKLMFMLVIFGLISAQEISIKTKVTSPMFTMDIETYQKGEFIISKSNIHAQGREIKDISVYKSGFEYFLVPEDSSQTLVKKDMSQMEAQVAQNKQLFGTVKFKASKRKKEVLGYEARSVKLSNEGGMGTIEGTIFIAKIDEIINETFKKYQALSNKMQPFSPEMSEGEMALTYKMSINLGQQMDQTIEVVSIDDKITDKDFVDKIISYSISK